MKQRHFNLFGARLLTLCLFSLFMTQTAFASSIGTTYGFSPRGMAMGNAMSAHVNDWSSVYYNMAGLGKTKELIERAKSKEKSGINQVSVNYLVTAPQLDININRVDKDGTPLSTNGAEDLDFGTFMMGFAMDLNTIYRMPDPVSSARMGFAMGTNDDLTVVKINDVDPRTHNFLRYGKEAQRALILAGAGFGFMDDLFGVGLGLNISFGGSGTIALSDLEVTEDEQIPIDNAMMDISLEPTMVAGLYFSPGRRYQALEGLNFGLTYRQKSKLDISPLNTVAKLKTGNVLLNLKLALLDYFQPDIFTFGTSWQHSQRLTLSLEAEFQRWSGFAISANHETNFANDLPELDDIIVPKLGFEYLVSRRLAIQGGYCYEPSFIPDSGLEKSINFLDSNKHIASIGASYRLPAFTRMRREVTLFAAFQQQFLEKRDVKKLEPTGVNPNYSFEGNVSTVYMGLTINM